MASPVVGQDGPPPCPLPPAPAALPPPSCAKAAGGCSGQAGSTGTPVSCCSSRQPARTQGRQAARARQEGASQGRLLPGRGIMLELVGAAAAAAPARVLMGVGSAGSNWPTSHRRGALDGRGASSKLGRVVHECNSAGLIDWAGWRSQGCRGKDEAGPAICAHPAAVCSCQSSRFESGSGSGSGRSGPAQTLSVPVLYTQ